MSNKYLEKIAMAPALKAVAREAVGKFSGSPAAINSARSLALRETGRVAKTVQGMGKSIKDIRNPEVMSKLKNHPGLKGNVFPLHGLADAASKAQSRAVKSGLGSVSDQLHAESVAARLARMKGKAA